ncbi:MAG: hypothetical protein VB959_16180, partial [Rhodospirillales bacterium]
MTGKKVGSASAFNVPELGGHGYAHTYEAGVLVNLTDWAGITLSYNHLDLELKGHNTSTNVDVGSDLYSVGFRLTY